MCHPGALGGDINNGRGYICLGAGINETSIYISLNIAVSIKLA